MSYADFAKKNNCLLGGIALTALFAGIVGSAVLVKDWKQNARLTKFKSASPEAQLVSFNRNLVSAECNDEATGSSFRIKPETPAAVTALLKNKDCTLTIY